MNGDGRDRVENLFELFARPTEAMSEVATQLCRGKRQNFAALANSLCEAGELTVLEELVESLIAAKRSAARAVAVAS